VTAIEIPTPDPRSLDETSRPFAEAVSGSYAVKRLIGRGGMGMVFLARDRRLDRLVAIKTLPPQLAKDPSLRERFLRETRTAGGMAHPNIVPIHGADEVDGHVFFVMSFIDGDSLAAHTRARGRLDAPTVGRYLRDVASALAHAHQRGIIHRDIKAENILIERSTDRALVTDFGIARLAEATPLTVTGQVLGTVYYVSPEQVSGSHVDARSDIYSLGVVGFLSLTGQFPFDAEVASAVLVAHVTRPAPTVTSLQRDVPPDLAAIVDRCLAKDPAQRFDSAEALLVELDRVLPTLGRERAAPALLTETEAHAVWKRAAELQASTGILPRPEAIPRPRDPAKPRSRTSGYDEHEVRAAAGEAGITERYVQHALVEHGVVGGKAVAGPRPPPEAKAIEKPSFWAGAPLKIVREEEIPGELAARDVERLINVLRDATGRLGHTGAKTRELAWWTGRFGSRLDVTVVPEQDRTTIRLVKGVRDRAIVAMTASLLVAGGITMPLVATIVMDGFGWGEEFGVMLGLASGLYLSVKAGRALFRWTRARAAERVRIISERLASKVRESLTNG
jgi:serine/threonine-protein kinase